MKRTISLILISLSIILVAGIQHGANAEEIKQADKGSNMQIIMETSLGTIKLELYSDKAPLTVSNILAYVDAEFYDNTIFHRVINGFMIQGGGFTADMTQKPTKPPVKNEADNGEKNDRGTIAMARTSFVDSATCQFFINLVDNESLNFKSKTDAGYGYCVFGKVIDGMEVVDKIAAVKTANANRHANVPIEPVIIKTVRRAAKPATTSN